VEITIKGNAYRTSLLSARKAQHVLRRLAPVMGAAASAFTGGREDGGLRALGEAIAALKDADWDYVVDTCLTVCQRQLERGSGWSPVLTPSGQPMFSTMQLDEELALVVTVLQENFAPFFSALLERGKELGITLPDSVLSVWQGGKTGSSDLS
jgi:hypothetical protein